jgi:hypothetical protein
MAHYEDPSQLGPCCNEPRSGERYNGPRKMFSGSARRHSYIADTRIVAMASGPSDVTVHLLRIDEELVAAREYIQVFR